MVQRGLLLMLVYILCAFVGSSIALPQASGPTSPEKTVDFRQRLAKAQNDLHDDLLRPTQDKGVFAARFFAFHAQHSQALQNELTRRIAAHEYPPSIGEQRDLANQLDHFLFNLNRYDLFASLLRLHIVTEEEAYSAMDDFPRTTDVFTAIRTLRDQAAQYKGMLVQHVTASQAAHDLKDLDALTKHRLYRVE